MQGLDGTVESTADDAPTASPLAPRRLIAVHPPGLRVSLDLGAAPLPLGRSPEGRGFAIPHERMSRLHCEIAWDRRLGTHGVIDRESRNGTFRNGVRLTPGFWPLAVGDLLRVGDVLFVYEAGHLGEARDPGEVDGGAVFGPSIVMRDLRRRVLKAAVDLAPVLILGESGAGKERLAREIHRLSGRKGALVSLNCSAISPTLAEAELFGHVAGAFTGATEARPGLFRAAHKGTLFLDEIGDLPIDLQPKLLRAIQEGEVRPVGSTEAVTVEVRIVAATHRDLQQQIARQAFRRDLYARLGIWALSLPSIAERRPDLMAWIDRLFEAWCEKRGEPPRSLRFSVEAAETLILAPWPENLRGVDRLVHELASTDAGRSRAIGVRDLPAWVGAAKS